MTDEVKWRLLEETGTQFEAELVRGALEEAGIPCVSGSEGPVDEFTSSRNLAGLGVEILVPEERLEDAREVLRRLREHAQDEWADDEWAGEPDPDPKA